MSNTEIVLNKLIVMVAPSYSKSELILDQLVDLGCASLQQKKYKSSNLIDELLYQIENGDCACWCKESKEDYKAISLIDLYDAVEYNQYTVITVTSDQLDQLHRVFPKIGNQVEIISYFVTDTSVNLLKNALEEDVVDHEKIVEVLRSQVYWGSVDSGRFYGVIRHSTADRAPALALQIMTDVWDAIHVDSFL